MEHLMNFSIFENKLYTPEIRDYIDDIFLEFSDGEYKVDIKVDEYIHTAPNTSAVVFGKNFIYQTDSEKQWGRLPGIGNRDWKLGFLVKISCETPKYAGNPSTLRWEAGVSLGVRRGRKKKVKAKREIESYEKQLNIEIKKIREFVESKIKMIKRRCPKEIFLHGVKMCDNLERTEFDFAFIYQELK